MSKTLLCALAVVVACAPRQTQAQPLVSNIAIHINRQDGGEPAPIQRRYETLIRSAAKGDEIVLLQKYFRNEVLNRAIVDAERRGVNILAIYRDEFHPRCEDLISPDDSIDCAGIFFRRERVHHKSMVLHRSNGNSTAIIGSYNLRERHATSPRVHTALSFDIESDDLFFAFYKLHADKILGLSGADRTHLQISTEGGGSISFTFHPSERRPLTDFLQAISRCDGPLWLSYYRVTADAVGKPVVDRLGQLVKQGCDVRFLLDRDQDNHAIEQQLKSRGIAVHYPDERDGKLTLGHKLLMVRFSQQLRLSQSSANINQESHDRDYNLSIQLTGEFPEVERTLEEEFLRYW